MKAPKLQIRALEVVLCGWLVSVATACVAHTNRVKSRRLVEDAASPAAPLTPP